MSKVNVVVYTRVSTEMQVDGYSLEAQLKDMKDYCKKNEYTILKQYEEAGHSGKNISGRPVFKQMMSDIEKGLKYDYVLVWKLSRFGRNACDIFNSLEELQRNDVNLICIKENIDSSTSSGKMMLQMLGVFAEVERDNISDATMNGRLEKARQGKWNGGFAPYGYILKDGKLEIVEEEAKIVRLIYKLYIDLSGYTSVTKYLNRQGIERKPPKNHPDARTEWNNTLVKRILDNPIYCGKIRYAQRRMVKVKGTKNQQRQNHENDCIISQGQHEAIIDVGLFELTKKKRHDTGVKKDRRIDSERTHLLSGILKCPACGSPMYISPNRWVNKNGEVRQLYYYSCGHFKTHSGGNCKNHLVRKDKIEKEVTSYIKDLVNNEQFAMEVKKRIRKRIDLGSLEIEFENYKRKLSQIITNKKLLEQRMDTLDTQDSIRKLNQWKDMDCRLGDLYNEIEQIGHLITDKEFEIQASKSKELSEASIYKILSSFADVYDGMNKEYQKRLIQSMVKEININQATNCKDRSLKSISFNFSLPMNEINSLGKGTTVETVVCMQKVKPKEIV